MRNNREYKHFTQDFSASEMRRKRRMVASFLLPFLLGISARSAADEPPTVIYDGPDHEAPEGSLAAKCPNEWWFNAPVHADHQGTRYNFVLRLGTKESTPMPGSAKYGFGDVVSTGGGAKLIRAWMIAFCFKVYDTDGSATLFVIQGGNGADGLQIIQPPSTDVTIHQTELTATWATYCYFRNYYDANWNFLYSEIIPGSCWSVQVT